MSNYLFIDGAYLTEAYGSAMSEFYGVVPPINYRDLGGNFGGPQRIYYYDAVDRGRVGAETESQQVARISARNELHAYLNSLPNWHVREGFVSRGRRASRRSQKAVDVQLAVDALEHAVARNMTRAWFIFGDLDFEPLLFSLNRFGIVTTVYYERTASPELLEAADYRIQLTLTRFHSLAVAPFKNGDKMPTFGENVEPLTGPIRTGYWNGRRVQLFIQDENMFLVADAGEDPIRQPTLYAHYPAHDDAKIVTAFTINYGDEITWD